MSAGVALLAGGVLAALAAAGLSLYRIRDLERRLLRRPWREGGHSGPGSLTRLGLVRFSAFDDTGGDYSFALSVLDSGGSGVVLTGLYHRERCRVYAKPVRGWASDQALTDEEREAIEQARNGSAESGSSVYSFSAR